MIKLVLHINHHYLTDKSEGFIKFLQIIHHLIQNYQKLSKIVQLGR